MDGKPSTYAAIVPNLEKCSQPEAAGSMSSTTSTSQSSASRKTSGKLVFGSNAAHATEEAQRVPSKKEPEMKEETKFQAFTGKDSLKG
ncbi:hypothetical protein MA16_Dca011230 [Dendrobium catenatum]|uniref:Uncharacterized protein n=1 Tax=Dendrobium catenatum TaxID=906689 RepID=A0A2I0VW69_9ASPA|nr:hypothetical protein MA16_Dca011230 [Dendrobium catenatum]